MNIMIGDNGGGKIIELFYQLSEVQMVNREPVHFSSRYFPPQHLFVAMFVAQNIT